MYIFHQADSLRFAYLAYLIEKICGMYIEDVPRVIRERRHC